jgi:hypothetical protein
VSHRQTLLLVIWLTNWKELKMFKIAFIAVDGEEREVVISADRESDAVKTVAQRDDFDLILTCDRLPTDGT